MKKRINVKKKIVILEKQPGGSSDKTLKREIMAITGGLKIINNLLPVMLKES